MKKIIAYALSMLVVALLLAGCAPSPAAGGGEAAQTNQEAPKAQEQNAPEQSAEKKKYVLAGTVLHEDQFSMLLQRSYEKTAQELGVEILTANVLNSADKEAELINTYIERGVDGIIIEPCAGDASVMVMQKAHDAGIPVLVCAIEADADFPFCTVANDGYDLGFQTGTACKKYIEENLAGKTVKIAMTEFSAQLPVLNEARVSGFFDGIKGCDYEIVARQDAWQTEVAVSKVNDMLTANKDIDLFFAANETGTIGGVMAIKAAGLTIPVFGVDGGVQISEMLLDPDNILQASTTQTPATLGKLAVENMIKYLNGEDLGETYLLLPGQLLHRDDPETIKAHKAEWESNQ